MRLTFKTFFIISILLLSYHSPSITNNEIIKICKREKNNRRCIKRLKLNRFQLNKGKAIEIPVIPYNK